MSHAGLLPDNPVVLTMPQPPCKPSRLYMLYPIYCAANLIGVLMMLLLNLFTPLEIFRAHRSFILDKGWLLGLVLFFAVFAIGLFLLHQVLQPIAGSLARRAAAETPEPAGQQAAVRRLLNLPFAMAGVNLTMWIVVSTVIGLLLVLFRDAPARLSAILIFRGVMVGLITSSLSFLFIEMYTRSRLIPHFFPEGKLVEVARVFRMSIVRRIRMLYGSGTINPMLLLVGTLVSVYLEAQAHAEPGTALVREILWFTLVLYGLFVVVALSLNYATGRSILEPIRSMMVMVKKVRGGDFHQRVQVVSNDELGVLADGMNDMAAGLVERERLEHSLRLAKEVQQALLPGRDPSVPGLDVAGTSIYCDETGGDYFDYLYDSDRNPRAIGVVVGDVSGHGVSAALLMASCRASLRQRAAGGGGPGAVVSDVNRQLARDVEDSGSFTTLFYLHVDLENRSLAWVRAGHEPALVYVPQADDFYELRGEGPALGIHADWPYAENRRDGIPEGQIIVIGTDGIWEARNAQGGMFGRERLCAAIRDSRHQDAKQIAAACIAALNAFQNGAPREDDVTLIILKFAAPVSDTRK
jgi:sigma-B regulation protein RsbU (phosphoserine phosphatase)